MRGRRSGDHGYPGAADGVAQEGIATCEVGVAERCRCLIIARARLFRAEQAPVAEGLHPRRQRLHLAGARTGLGGTPLLRGEGREVVSARDRFAWRQVGGERRYGLGRIRLLELASLESHDAGPFGGVGDGSELVGPRVDLGEQGRIWAHTAVEGDLEALVGREWSERGAGRRVTGGTLCWAPGSVCSGSAAFRVSPHGIWTEVDDGRQSR